MSQNELVTKLQAAQRQLTVATELYFHDADPIAVHTLVAAAYNIIRDLSKHRGAPGMAVKDYFPTTVSPSKQQAVTNWVNSFENFFKHADRDPDGEIEFNADITESMLMDAWAQYERLGGSLPETAKVFKLWIGNVKEDAWPELKQLVSRFKQLNKQQFYETLRPMMSAKP